MKASRILVLGSGGREHALAWRLARDAHAPQVFVAPGNDGMARRFTRLSVSETDPAAVVKACRAHLIELVVIGPESALAAGVSDALTAAGIRVFGASREAARLESSKWFAKEVMSEAGVPTARAALFTNEADALAALPAFGPVFVVKADGLAAGKGVRVTSELADAEAFVRECLSGERFGGNGSRVVLEEFLEGEEASVIAICDGERFLLLPAARDHKRAFDGDLGPNTGGMGALAPTAAVTPAIEREAAERVVAPVLRVLAARGTPYRGALYCGLMLTAGGVRVIEFNARFGDPETQAIMPLITGDLTALLASAACGQLDAGAVGRAPLTVVTIAIVDEFYPDALRGGGEIAGLDAIESREGCLVFYAGATSDAGQWRVSGGRAAYVTAIGHSAAIARERAYAGCASLRGAHWRVRTDIGMISAPRSAHSERT